MSNNLRKYKRQMATEKKEVKKHRHVGKLKLSEFIALLCGIAALLFAIGFLVPAIVQTAKEEATATTTTVEETTEEDTDTEDTDSEDTDSEEVTDEEDSDTEETATEEETDSETTESDAETDAETTTAA